MGVLLHTKTIKSISFKLLKSLLFAYQFVTKTFLSLYVIKFNPFKIFFFLSDGHYFGFYLGQIGY